MNSIIRFSILGIIVVGLLVICYQYLEWATVQHTNLQNFIRKSVPGSEAAVDYQIAAFRNKTFPITDSLGAVVVQTPIKLCPNWIADAWKPVKFQLIYQAKLLGVQYFS